MGYGTLIQDIVYKISGRTAASSGLYSLSTYQYQWALGGVPFLSATSDTRPDVETGVEQRKQQFDAFKDPGEYSLNQWWLRSQTSFIGGEGIVYQDPDTQGTSKNIRYAQSIGIDPFTDPDLLQLLRESVDVTQSDDEQTEGAMYAKQFTHADDEAVWLAKGRTVWMNTMTSGGINNVDFRQVTVASTSSHWVGGMATLGASPPIMDATTEEYAFTVMDEGAPGTGKSGIWRTSNGFPSMSITQAYIIAPLDLKDPVIGSARGLVAFGNGSDFYMLSPTATGAALPTENARVPSDQLICGIADGPDAVYVAANSHYGGFIYKSTFDTNGVVNGLTLVATLPVGENVNDIASYVNTFLVIATTTGVRVGSFTGDGVTYSPSIITVPRTGIELGPESGSGFGRIAFYGTKAYVTTQGTPQHDGDFGIMAIDLSTIIQDDNTGASFNAYATWVYLPGTSTPIDDVTATTSGRLVYTTDRGLASKAIAEHSVNLISMGYLDTGRIRFNTVEPKLFKYMSIRTPTPLQGDITVSLLDQGGGITNYITYGPTLDPGTEDISTPTPAGPQNWIALRFTLRRGLSDPTIGAQLDSWQVKALPGTLKQRRLVKQFLCFNGEKDMAGNIIQGDTYSLERLTAVRQMYQRGDTVTLQDLVNNISDQVVIDDYQFAMLAPPGPNSENYGGYLTVTMRTVADNVPPLTVTGNITEDE